MKHDLKTDAEKCSGEVFALFFYRRQCDTQERVDNSYWIHLREYV